MKILRSGNLTPEDLKPAALVDLNGVAVPPAVPHSLFTPEDLENVASFAAFADGVIAQSGGSSEDAEKIRAYCRDLCTRLAMSMQQ